MTDREDINLLQSLRPLHLGTALATYLTGAGLARYLGARLEGSMLALGMLWLVCLLGGFFFLGDHLGVPLPESVFPLDREKRVGGAEKRSFPAGLLLYAALAFLSAAAFLTILLVVQGAGGEMVWGWMAVYFALLAGLTLAGPRLESTGLGEFIISICLVIFPPALAFLSLAGGFQRYLSLAIFPLFPLHLALMLTLRLRSYQAELRQGQRTFLVQIGWKRGIFLHNLLVLSGFLLFGAAALFGLPLRIGGPVFTALIPAGYLIWYYAGLERGAPTRWRMILLLALAVLLVPIYYLLFASWIY